MDPLPIAFILDPHLRELIRRCGLPNRQTSERDPFYSSDYLGIIHANVAAVTTLTLHFRTFEGTGHKPIS